MVDNLQNSPGAKRIRVCHETRYRYQPAVTISWHRAHLEPGNTPCQTVMRVERYVNPYPSFEQQTEDAFGNRQWFFNQETAHAELMVRVVSELQTWSLPPAQDAGTTSWEATALSHAYEPGQPAKKESLFAYPSSYVPRGQEFIDFSTEVFFAQRPLRDSCIGLTELVHRQIEYNRQTTTIHTPTKIALAQRSGVCQDFAHIMLACLRSRGLAARYVSGYLITEPANGQPKLIGADASHAWVSVYLGDGHWLDCDPTNNCSGLASPGPAYVRLAVGRDFADVSPLRGVIHGGAQHQLEVAVTVESEPDTLAGSYDDSVSTWL